MESVNLFDIIVISLVLILGIKGVINGLIKEIFVLAGLIGGVFVASRTASLVGDLIDQNLLHLENKSSLSLIGFVAVLVGVWLLSIILASIVKKMVSMSGLGFIDRFLGFIVGSAKIFFIISIIIYAISSIEIAKKNLSKYLDNSIMYPIMVDFGSFIIKLDTDKLTQGISSKITPEDSHEQIPTVDINKTLQMIKDEANITKKLEDAGLK